MLYFCKTIFLFMSSKAKFTDISLFQANDSVDNIFRPSVEVPREVKLKVKRPTLNLLDEERVESGASADTAGFSQTLPQETSDNNPAQPEDQNLQAEAWADTLDRTLINQWVESGFDKELWVSPSDNDEKSLESLQKKTSGETAISEEMEKQEEKETPKPGQKAVETIEEIEISDPSLVSEKRHEKTLQSQDWFLGVIVVLVAITGIVRYKWQKYMNDVFNAVLFSNIAGKLKNSTSRSDKTASFWMGFLFYSSFSVFLFETMRLSDRTFLGLSEWKLLLSIMGFLVVVFTLKLVVYRFVGWLFDVRKPIIEYLYQSSVMSKAFGIILMPLIVVFPFMEPQAREWIPKVGFTVFILLYLLQIGRGIGANLRNTLSGYYIILYLCALEILPLSILYKVLFY